MAKITIFQESCKGVDGCGICLFICLKNLFSASNSMNDAGYFPTKIEDEAECTGCQNCMVYCPDFAIVIEKEESDSGDSDEGENG